MRSEIVTMPGWNEVKAEFAPDGALRDIYVFGTDRVDWEKMLTALPKSPYEIWQRPYDDGRNKKQAGLPVTFPTNETKRSLYIKVENELILDCHFFIEEEIELDLVPQRVESEQTYDRLLGFMQWLADLLGKPAVLTQENSPDWVIVRVAPKG
jgi:hypothetical protein